MISCKKDKLICTGHMNYFPERNHDKVTIKKGIWGDIWFWEGDFMPFGMGTITPVSRDVRIHELTKLDDVVRTTYPYSAFYDRINTTLICSTRSDSYGFFEVELPTGSYSIFVVEDSLFYSNSYDGQGNIYPFFVDSGEVTGIRFDITYLAYY